MLPAARGFAGMVRMGRLARRFVPSLLYLFAFISAPTRAAHGAWYSFHRLIPSPNGSFYFGTAMAAIDDRFLVGDPGDYSGATPGAVHLVDARTGEILRTILAPDPQTYGDSTFGQTVARRATDIVVGAPGQLVGGVAAAGLVY